MTSSNHRARQCPGARTVRNTPCWFSPVIASADFRSVAVQGNTKTTPRAKDMNVQTISQDNAVQGSKVKLIRSGDRCACMVHLSSSRRTILSVYQQQQQCGRNELGRSKPSCSKMQIFGIPPHYYQEGTRRTSHDALDCLNKRLGLARVVSCSCNHTYAGYMHAG